MNIITEKQNEPDKLKLQYAARVFYNRAEKCNYIIWVLCILSSVMVFFSNSGTATTFVIVIIFFSDIFAFCLNKYMKKAVIIAADFKKLFDRQVFGEEIDCINTQNPYEKLTEFKEKLIMEKAIEFTVQSANSGADNPPGVKNWYYVDPNTQVDVAIFECQKQNVWWDKKISAYQRLFVTIVVVLVVIIAILLFRANILSEIVLIIFSQVWLLIKICERILTACNYKKISIEIDTIVNSFVDFSERKGIYNLQSKIEKRREIPLTHINLFHKNVAPQLTDLYLKIKGW